MKKRNRILIVDDVEINRSLLTDMLSDDYDILEAQNGTEAVAYIHRFHAEISLVLLDIVMPEMDGFEVLAVMNKAGYIGEIPVIVISAEDSSSYVDHAYDLGAVEYIGRPFDEKTVRYRVRNTIMLYAKQKLLEDMVTDQMLEKEKINLIMVEILSHIVEFRNGESGLHVLHIRVITETLLKHLARMTDRYDLPLDRISLIANASALHDIGKVSIPEHIVNKPGKLTKQEYEIMKSHSAIGAEMLESVTCFQNEELVKVARDICRWHHERYDGKGYPDGLKGEEIPIAAQVVAIADVYDALTNERVYKPAYTHQTALDMIISGECGSFNPLLLQCLKETAEYLRSELKLHSAGKTTRDDLHNAVRSLLENGKLSNRTLTLLEQERTKYQFFASMSNEIQFEYDVRTDLLTISDWGAAWLGIPAVISHPQKSEVLSRMLHPKAYLDLQQKMRGVTPEAPVITGMYNLNVKGEQRWYKAIARPLWMGGDQTGPTGVIGKFVDVHDEQTEMMQLKTMEQRDILTGLYNREYSHMLITRYLRKGLSEERRYAFVLLDLDFFRTANDRHGHLFGDDVLRTVADRVRYCTRDTDVIVRVGGDEFLVFLEYREDITPLINRLFSSFKEPYRCFEIRISIGISLAPKDGTDYALLFHRADQALYAAKQYGRNRYCYYNDSMKELPSIVTPIENRVEPSNVKPFSIRRKQ